MQPIFGMITPTVAVIGLVALLVIFGPGKLPQIGKALGGGIKEFKDVTNGAEVKDSGTNNEPLK